MVLQLALQDIGQLTDLDWLRVAFAIRVVAMQTPMAWAARWWPLYLVAGLGWVTLGAVLGVPRGVGLIFIGLICLAFAVQPLLARSSRGR
jgi:hypothetical protein